MMIRTLLHHHSHHSPRHYRHSHLNSKCCTQLVVRCFTTTPQKEYEDAYQDEDEDGDTTTTTAVVTRTIAGRNNDARGGSAGGWSRTAIPTPTWNTTTATSSSNTNSSNRVPLYQIQSQLQTRSQSKLQSQLQLHPKMESSTLSSLTMTLTSLPIVAATTATRQRDQSATTHSSCRRGYPIQPHQQYQHRQYYRHFTTHSMHHQHNLLTVSSIFSPHYHQQQHQQQHRQQIRTVFISTENTPNPESIKFLPGTTVLDNEDGRGHSILKSDPVAEILKSPLATSLFKIDGVKAIYYGSDFVSITKFATGKWQFMRPEIFSVLMDFFETPEYQVLLEQPLITDTTILEDDDEIVAMIKELIEDRIRPAVQDDGGDILYVNFDEESGMVTVQLAGSCVGCPSSSVTLKQGVENMLMHYIPEVTAVQALDQPEEEDDDDMDGDVTITTTTTNNNDNDNDSTAAPKQQKSYEERLAAAGIPFSD